MSDGGVVKLGGEEFRAAEKVPLMALMRFAHVAQKQRTNEVEEWAALYDLCSAVIHAEDWPRFMDKAVEIGADDKTLMLVVRKVITGQTDRPTQRPSDSSDGPESTEPKSESEEESSPVAEQVETWLKVKTQHEANGRPDKALIVLMAHEQRMASAS